MAMSPQSYYDAVLPLRQRAHGIDVALYLKQQASQLQQLLQIPNVAIQAIINTRQPTTVNALVRGLAKALDHDDYNSTDLVDQLISPDRTQTVLLPLPDGYESQTKRISSEMAKQGSRDYNIKPINLASTLSSRTYHVVLHYMLHYLCSIANADQHLGTCNLKQPQMASDKPKSESQSQHLDSCQHDHEQRAQAGRATSRMRRDADVSKLRDARQQGEKASRGRTKLAKQAKPLQDQNRVSQSMQPRSRHHSSKAGHTLASASKGTSLLSSSCSAAKAHRVSRFKSPKMTFTKPTKKATTASSTAKRQASDINREGLINSPKLFKGLNPSAVTTTHQAVPSPHGGPSLASRRSTLVLQEAAFEIQELTEATPDPVHASPANMIFLMDSDDEEELPVIVFKPDSPEPSTVPAACHSSGANTLETGLLPRTAKASTCAISASACKTAPSGPPRRRIRHIMDDEDD
eukprot:m.48769 g.48769  ORF g.48769 m.48769 type:complete len:463 (-) comp13319_c0_seq2:45-1433(-)